MGIMEKLSDLRRKKLDEGWQDTARKYKSMKDVKDFHRKRLADLDFRLETKYGEWKVTIRFGGSSNIWVDVHNSKGLYVSSKSFNSAKDVKAYLFNGGLTADLNKKIRENAIDALKNDKITPAEMKETFDKASQRIAALEQAIDIQIDEDELDKKLHRHQIYGDAVSSREHERYWTRHQAEKEFESERPFEVGDIVYGDNKTSLRSGKEYRITSISGNAATVEPANGRGNRQVAALRHLMIHPDVVKAAIENPDDPKYFDQQKYMMDRYGNNFDEAVELLNSCGMIVEAKS